MSAQTTTQLVNVKSSAKVKFSAGSVVRINGNYLAETNSQVTLEGTVTLRGDWINNGTQTSLAGSLIFIGDGNSLLSGNGSTQFYRVYLNKDTETLELQFDLIPADGNGFLVLQKGIFHLIGDKTFTHKLLPLSGSTLQIPSDGGLWLANPNATISAQDAGILLLGLLKIDDGIFNLGTSVAHSLEYAGTTTKPAKLEINGGDLNIAGGLFANINNNTIDFSQVGGKVEMAMLGSPSKVFSINEVDSKFNATGGELVIDNPSSASNSELNIYCDEANSNVTDGHTVKIDAKNINSVIELNLQNPIGNLLMTGTNNPQVKLQNNLTAMGNVTIAGEGQGRLDLNSFNIRVAGDWNHNITSDNGFVQGENTLTFIGDKLQNISASSLTPKFSRLVVDKSDESVKMNTDVNITEALCLLGGSSKKSIIDLYYSNLIIDANANIYSALTIGNVANTDLLTFSNNNHIANTGSNSDPLLGGHLVKKLLPNEVISGENGKTLLFPLGATNIYTPISVQFYSGAVTIGSNPEISIKLVPLEHPAIEVSQKSLQRYWNISSNDITVAQNGVTLTMIYSTTPATGSEGNYHVLRFAPAWNTPNGYWRIDPGVRDDVVDFNLKQFYSQGASDLDGDWTAGELAAARAVYYSRQNGDYNDPQTWSKYNFGGQASNTIPNKLSDVVRIRGNRVTVSGETAKANLISVESAFDDMTAGELYFTDENYVRGDTLRIQPGATIGISSSVGITVQPNETGNVRTSVRDFSENANYAYCGGSNPQVVGNALPNTVNKILVEKEDNTTLLLTQNVLIAGGIHIENGVFDLDVHSINGNVANRTMTMSGGELIINSSIFPLNYTPPIFNAGQITFAGNSNVTIPSTLSAPAVGQYNNLKIKSTGRNGNITLSGVGEIIINNQFDISEMNFADNSYRIFTDGSTVRFNKNVSGSEQIIPYRPASPNDVECQLNYYNLILDGDGIKKINNSVNTDFVVLNSISILNNANFVANGIDIDIYGNWTNNGGYFYGQSGEELKFISEVPSVATNILSGNSNNNYFYDVDFGGVGIINILDDFRCDGNLTINANNTLVGNSAEIIVKGNWTNNGGIFNYGTSEVVFSGQATQNLSKITGDEEFYNLSINNNNSVTANAVGSAGNGIIIHNDLTLLNGNLRSHVGSDYRFVEVLGNVNHTSGFVDGELRKNIVADAAGIIQFEVGFVDHYNPVTLTFNGTGGTEGILGVLADEITSTSSPISNNGYNIIPSDCSIDYLGNIATQYVISKPTGSTFVLGTNRTYNAKIDYSADQIRNASLPDEYDIAIYNGTDWIAPFSYNSSAPVMSNRQAYFAEISGLKDIGAAVVGPPGMLTYYTRQDGDWTNPENWSNQMYGGIPAASYPTGQSRVFIGNGNAINLNLNVSINDQGQVIIDTLGTLNTNNYTIDGNGSFKMLSGATLGITSPDGITNSGNGNIQTVSRDYNSDNHNNSTFVYYGSENQVTGDGLPNIISSLKIDKTNSTDRVTINAGHDLRIDDSLYIAKGILNAGSSDDIYMFGNIRQTTDGVFEPATQTVYLRGDKQILLTGGSTLQTLNFYNLNIFKEYSTGSIVLNENSNIFIENNLTFETNNKVIIDANTYSTNANHRYVKFGENATVTNAGYINRDNSGGWIWGEVQKYVVSNSANVKFEIGSDIYYSPFEIDLRNGDGTEGYIATRAIEGKHPDLFPSPSTTYPINPTKNISVYWRLTKPEGSSFDRGNRTADFSVWFKNPEQQVNLDCFACADLAFYRGAVTTPWQGLPHNTPFGNAGAMDTCSDTRIFDDVARTTANGFPTFEYTGDSCAVPSELGFIKVPNVSSGLSFGSELLEDGSIRLGDFVAGNRNNTVIQYFTFYSINDGDWTDPNTWSTVGYNSTENAAVALYQAGNDPYMRPFPSRRYDNVYIGNNKKVTLDIDIGTNEYSPTAMFGPTCYVENTGTLDFGTNVFRGTQFQAYKGATLIIGSDDGINKSNLDNFKGNLQLSYYSTAPLISDSINVIYSPKGKTSNGMSRRLINRNSQDLYIEHVKVFAGASPDVNNDTPIFEFQSDDKYISSTYGNLRGVKGMKLDVGQTYSLWVKPRSTSVPISGNATGSAEVTQQVTVPIITADQARANNYWVTTGTSVSGSRTTYYGYWEYQTTISGTVTASNISIDDLHAYYAAWADYDFKGTGWQQLVENEGNVTLNGGSTLTIPYTQTVTVRSESTSYTKRNSTYNYRACDNVWNNFRGTSQNVTFTVTGSGNVSGMGTLAPLVVGSFTIPDIVSQGTTLFRVGLSNESLKDNVTRNGQVDTVTISSVMKAGVGEYEDYSLFIKNPNYTANQVSGTGLPEIVKTLEVRSENPANTHPTFTLDKNLTIIDQFKVTSGTFMHGKLDTINLFGNFIIDTLDGYNADIYHETNYELYKPYNVLGGVVKLLGNRTQELTGLQPITLNKLEIDKTGGDVLAKNDLIIGNKIEFISDTKLILDDNVDVTFGGYVEPKAINDGFSESKMIDMPGDSLAPSKIIKDLIVKKSEYSSATPIHYYENSKIDAGNNKPRIYLATLSTAPNSGILYKFLPNQSATIQNPEYSNTGYSNYTESVPAYSISPGDYYINVTCGSVTDGSTNIYAYCYIDNNWDSFGLGDMVGEKRLPLTGASPRGTVISIPITIPDTLYNGPVRMRLKTAHNTYRPEPDHNETYLDGTNRKATGGEIEDYMLNIVNARQLPVQDPNSPKALVYDTVYVADSVVKAVNPTFATPPVSNNSNYRISKVVFNDVEYPINYPTNINNTVWNSYKVYPFSDTLTLVAGSNNIFEFQLSNSSNYYCLAWADFTHKGYFEDNYDDRMIVGRYNRYQTPTNIITMNMAIPDTAFNGITRLRLKLRQGSSFGNNSYRPNNGDAITGQVIDFNVNVIGGRDPYPLTYLQNNSIDPDKLYSYQVKKRLIINTFEVEPKIDSLVFPIGTDGDYDPAEIVLKNKTLDENNASVSVKLVKGIHSHRYFNNILNKYWRIRTEGVTIPNDAVSNVFRFHYDEDDVNGEVAKYVPGRYIENEGWEINLGINPTSTSTLMTITNEPILSGDWTAGYSEVYFSGRIFYSRQNGNWNDRNSWSTDRVLRHTGIASSYFPGELYLNDVVNIDGHTIVFSDSLHIVLDSLHIGGTNTANGDIDGDGMIDGNSDAIGELVFTTTNPELNPGTTQKSLELRSLFLDDDAGKVYSTGDNINDTLIIHDRLINNSTLGGVFLNDGTNRINLKFAGDDNSYVLGEGAWNSMADIIVKKERGLQDTLLIQSSNFLSALESQTLKYVFMPQSGVIVNDLINHDLYLSSDAQDVDMQVNSGIDVIKGRTITRGNLFTNANTVINIDDKIKDDEYPVSLEIGEKSNINLMYRTGSIINVIDGRLNISAGLNKVASNSIITVNIAEKGEIFVNTDENTSTDKLGFDLSNAGSIFNMSGGRIVVANAGGTSSVSADFRINAQGGIGMTGGVIQTGDSTLTTIDGTKIKLAGSTPLWNLHFANSYDKNVKTEIVEQVETIKNDWLIDANHNFDLNGNTVNLGGNLENYGLFNGCPVAETANPWKLVLNGSGEQNLFNAEGIGLVLYNLTLNKNSGQVTLDDNGNSNLLIRNTLEFSGDNTAVIKMNSNLRYVKLQPTLYSTSQVFRIGLGHVAGLLYRQIEDNTLSSIFPIGGNDASKYRPVTFELTDIGNTAGLLGARFNDIDHPNAGDVVNGSVNIQKYWTILPAGRDGITQPDGTIGFALGENKKYNLTLQFIDDDILGGVSPLNLDQFVYSPALVENSLLSTWTTLETFDKALNTNKSVSNSIFGDFILGEPTGIQFYSISDGDWNDASSWSNDGYESSNVAGRFPNASNDVVHIGNGKKITVPANFHPVVYSIIVEKYNGNPGFLQINGNLGYVSGKSFVLNDDCTLGIQHIYGIATVKDRERGAVTTESRTFGVSRYVYNGVYGSQLTGDALPNTIKSLILDNSSTLGNNKTLFLNESSDNSTFVVLDSLYIRQGSFNPSSRIVNLKNSLVLDSVINDGNIMPASSKFVFSGANTYMNIGNKNGAKLHNLELNNTILNTFIPNVTSSSLYPKASIVVGNELKFNGVGSVLLLGDSIDIYVDNPSPTAIIDYSNNSFVRTSSKSGMLIRKIAAGNNYIFPIGSLEDGNQIYAPFEFIAGSDGEAGKFGARTSWGQSTVHIGAHAGMLNGMENPKFLKRYWTVDSVTTTVKGEMRFYFDNRDLFAGTQIIDIERIARWNPTYERKPGLWTSPFDLALNAAENYFYTPSDADSSVYSGDWTFAMSSMFRRIFFSRQSGNWNDYNTWTFNNNHSGLIAGIDLFPNAAKDSVVIGADHSIMLNISSPFDSNEGVGISLGTSATNYGTLDLGQNILNGENFVMKDNSTLMIGSNDGINSIESDLGNIQTTNQRIFSIEGNYIYSGNSNQNIGNALPATVKNLTVANSGDQNNNSVLFDRNLSINGDFVIISGKADLQSYSLTGNNTNSKASIADNSYLRIAGSNNLAQTLVNFADFSGITNNSFIEFYGDEQDVSIVPTEFYDHTTKLGIGYGNLMVSNGKNQKVTRSILVRHNLYTIGNNIGLDTTKLIVNSVNSLEVRGSIFNHNAEIFNNDGIIEIGE